MPLWGSKDNAANSDIAAVIQYKKATTTANQSSLYKNVTANAFMKSAQGNVVVGQWAVDSNEIRAANQAGRGHPQHSGWVIRHEGRGLKAGRVWYETLVASGSIPTTDGSDDTYFPDYAISIATQPSSNSSATAGNLTFTVATSTVPTGGTVTYQWQKNNGGWANVANVAGKYSNNTSPTFTANNQTANGNVFRVLVSTANSNTITSANATIIWYTP